MSSEALTAILAPVVIVELALKYLALQHLWRRHDLEMNRKMSWIASVAVVPVFGWAAYYLKGRQQRDLR